MVHEDKITHILNIKLILLNYMKLNKITLCILFEERGMFGWGLNLPNIVPVLAIMNIKYVIFYNFYNIYLDELCWGHSDCKRVEQITPSPDQPSFRSGWPPCFFSCLQERNRSGKFRANLYSP
jgi:hypothetical protein